MLGFTLVGLALQLGGAGVAGWGARLIWRDVATEGERLADPIVALGHRIWHRAADSLGRLFRRPRSQTIEVGGIRSTESAGSVRVRKSYPPLADTQTDRDAIRELDERTRAIIADLGRAEGRLLDKIEKQNDQHRAISTAFDDYVRAQERQERQRDIRGIRFEVFGLALVTLGALAQALGSVLAPTQSG